MNGSTPFTDTESATESGTSTLTQDGITDVYTKNASSTDLYTLAESGRLTQEGFTETVTGTDGYATNEVGNTGLQTDTSTTTGGGNGTRTSSGPGVTLASGSGSNGYTLVATGNALTGSFNETGTGTDRYKLVESFDEVVNDTNWRYASECDVPFREQKMASTPSKTLKELHILRLFTMHL